MVARADAGWAPHDPQNEVGLHASALLQSERARVNPELVEGFMGAIQGSAIYLPEFVGEVEGEALLKQLTDELLEEVRRTEGRDVSLEDTGVAWSQHLKHEDPTFSETFQFIVAKLAKHFDCAPFATRLNIYRDGTDWKPFHHDSHAYHKASGGKEDFTMGFSLGATRTLEFLHCKTDVKFGFPQGSGACFAFTSDANKEFQHGVPRAQGACGLRVSIIAWGRRQKLTPRNSTAQERRADPARAVENPPLCECGCRAPKARRPPAAPKSAGGGAEKKKKKKSRLQ
eukprot:TRINITY_DN1039_c0_g2_i1.p1 TRINITY_DN1039_c0_g2~~TRINITY_DN1039_c0_g2_i1.p1  ORF type:complete len:300 (+),score=121.51 TRINITY_DN1039_c0_g2_i1:46-900(+)